MLIVQYLINSNQFVCYDKNEMYMSTNKTNMSMRHVISYRYLTVKNMT